MFFGDELADEFEDLLLADIRAASGLGAVDVLLVSPYEHSTAHNYEFVSRGDLSRAEVVKRSGPSAR